MKKQLLSFCENSFYQSNGQLVLSEQLKKIFSKVFNWLLGQRFDISLNKGLLFVGDFGTGKSVIMKAVIKFIEVYYSEENVPGGIVKPLIVLSQDMANYFRDNDTYMINRMKTSSILAIDDLGYETKKVSYYGTECCPFEEVLMSRYDKRKLVVLTTNMTMAKIKEHYGEHISDRLKQMTYVIEISGESKRR